VVDIVKFRTDKEQVIGWSNSKKTNIVIEFDEKNIKAQSVYNGNYTKKILKKLLKYVENRDCIEISLYNPIDNNNNILVFKNLDNNKVFVIAPIIIKDSEGLKDKTGIAGKKY